MSDQHTRDHHGASEENLAEFAAELRLLAEAVLERVEPVLRKTAADGRAEWSSCAWCPVCAAAALLRGEHHDVVAAIADHGTALVTVLREALAGVPVEPIIPPEADPDSPEYAAAHQHSWNEHGAGSAGGAAAGGRRASYPGAAAESGPQDRASGPGADPGVPEPDSASGPDAATGPDAFAGSGAALGPDAGSGPDAGRGPGAARGGFWTGGDAPRFAGEAGREGVGRGQGTGSGAPSAGRGGAGAGRGVRGTGREGAARSGYVPISVTIKPPTT
ncbi:hypothetical protein [Nocardia sp. CC227C]|uniref:hypothetical protein n=1 Tax=Nocardia sp. CC227C TaxID=3044562 RepID=UPI00278C7650|nr:hypothetical protein [Nocardia sp. CC227C]